MIILLCILFYDAYLTKNVYFPFHIYYFSVKSYDENIEKYVERILKQFCESKSIFVHNSRTIYWFCRCFLKWTKCKKNVGKQISHFILYTYLYLYHSRDFRGCFCRYLYILFSRKKCQNTQKRTIQSHMTNNCVNGQQLFITVTWDIYQLSYHIKYHLNVC